MKDKKLFIFGDSFASYTVSQNPRFLTKEQLAEMEENEPCKEDMWFFQLARKLNCNRCIMIGIPGSSLDVMQHYFNQLVENNHVSKDDYIICIHTEASRRWFVPELPEMTNFVNFIDFKTGDVNWEWLANTLGEKITNNDVEITSYEKKIKKYVTLSKRQDKPDSVLWLIKSYPQLKDSQIAKLVGITKNSVVSIRNKSYWNYNNLNAKDPVAMNLFTQKDLIEASEKAERRIKREKKLKEKALKASQSQNS